MKIQGKHAKNMDNILKGRTITSSQMWKTISFHYKERNLKKKEIKYFFTYKIKSFMVMLTNTSKDA